MLVVAGYCNESSSVCEKSRRNECLSIGCTIHPVRENVSNNVVSKASTEHVNMYYSPSICISETWNMSVVCDVCVCEQEFGLLVHCSLFRMNILPYYVLCNKALCDLCDLIWDTHTKKDPPFQLMLYEYENGYDGSKDRRTEG